jgi:hypothetical protein
MPFPVLQARAPEAESMQVAPRAEVSDIDTGLSVMQADTRKLTDITSSDLAQRSMMVLSRSGGAKPA